MINRSNWNDEIEKKCKEYVLLPETEDKLHIKHGVYVDDIEEAFQDPCWVIRKSKRESPPPKSGHPSKGTVYDIIFRSQKRTYIVYNGKAIR